MQYEKIIEKILSSKSKVKVLDFLVNNPGYYSAYSICQFVEISPRASLLTLKELVEINIVIYDDKKGYKLNEDNFFSQNIVLKIFKTSKKKLTPALKQFILELVEPYNLFFYSILINDKLNMLIILNFHVTDEKFSFFARDFVNQINKRIKDKFSFAIEINVFKKNFIPYDIYEKWFNTEPIFGEKLGKITFEDEVSPEEIKKAFQFFNMNQKNE